MNVTIVLQTIAPLEPLPKKRGENEDVTDMEEKSKIGDFWMDEARKIYFSPDLSLPARIS